MESAVIKEIRNYLEQIGYSKGTQILVPDCLKDFLRFLKLHLEDKSFKETSSEDVLKYHEYLKNRRNKRRTGYLSESYINHHIYSLKVFFSFQQEKGNIAVNPMNILHFPTPQHKPRDILSQAEIGEVFEVCSTFKEKAVLSVFYGLGLRRSEGENLNLQDVNFKNSILVVKEGKGKKRRAIPMSATITRHLKNYVQKERFARAQTLHFFCNRQGLQVKGAELNNILKELLAKTTIKKNISLHCLRHSIATHLLENGVSVEYVRDFLGHQNLESTQIYTRVKKEQVWKLKTDK